ncbi:hypothetical protein H6G80_30370 [Nostoc sp. FACHB-87]|uniref:hypothetical protein n=1 Tax=Nostocaceae TaxID=1162 RepID=UPI00168332F9|nr:MULTISPECIES: hypothetical protein [Nostocaceae]MBD2458360.1 hypothetical protein [Nostoc sp. FACHB-87]MBD2479329.1 hypothetical protein [Anabaena sp. FACHB-83]
MALFTAEGLSYPQALKLIEILKKEGIESNITSGGVAVKISPEQVNKAQKICEKMGANFNAGYSTTEENTLIKGGEIKNIERVKNDSSAIIQEWRDDE